MRKEVRQAIQTKAETVTGFTSANVFYGKAPNGQAYPYMEYHGISDDQELDSVNTHETQEVQFTLYGVDGDDLSVKFGALLDVFNFSTLTITGWTNLEIRPIPGTLQQQFDDVWQIVKSYRLWNFKTRA